MQFHEMTDGDLAFQLRVGCEELFRRRKEAGDEDSTLSLEGYEISAQKPVAEKRAAKAKAEPHEPAAKGDK